MKTLSISTVPLHGTCLIEASAGTGKTFTLTGLYLRLLLEGRFDVSQLLVVTFTEAATDELRGRVRERLREAVAALEAGCSKDPVLSSLLVALEDHGESAQQLRDAITRLDEAAIFTIHGFCQRMLGEHAFESGALFDSELTADATTLQLAVVEDFWRTHFYDADPELAAWIRGQWATPADLLRGLAPWLQNAAPRVLPPADDGRVETVEKALYAAWTQARRQWDADEIRQLLLDAPGLGRAQGTYRGDKVEEAVAAAESYFSDEQRRPFVPEAMALLTSERLANGMTAKAVKNGVKPPSHGFFDACGTLVARARDFEALRRARILAEAADYLCEGLARRKRETRQLTFNDLLVDLDAALQGEGGDALARTISERFPVALVDEFQDTDPLQYRIFERIYGGTQTGAWYMIGDPKQAIYGFRGADIFTYIRARRTTDEQQHFTLDTNWRSASALVEAVNGLFSRAEAPFVFDDDIPFRPVVSSDRADREPLRLEGETPPALEVWPIEAGAGKVMSKAQAQSCVARACAAEIARLLTLGREGRATIGARPLRPGDVAVLVPTRNEADAVRRAFDRAGIKSVYISRDSVFDTEEAQALGHLLAAVAEPGSDRRLRAALSTHLLGADAAMLDAGDEDPRWLQTMDQFQRHHDEWLQRGFMPFFQRLLHRHHIPARLLAMPDGERRLTNLLQLGELAQAASTGVWGMTGLMRWLAEQRCGGEGDAEDKQLRLESDAGLVKIVTIHKSKGLEYPLVFLPFLWSTRVQSGASGKASLPAVTFHDPEDQVYSLDLGSHAYLEHRQQARIEQLAEDLRLLYVALTRARHRCYVAWGRINGAAASALAYLLYQPLRGDEINLGSMDDAAAMAPWQALAEAMPRSVAVTGLPSGDGRAPAEDADAARLGARTLGEPVPRGWRIASYSSLSAGQASVAAGAETPDHDAVDDVTAEAEVTPVAETQDPFATIARFPRGARAGTCLHALMERLDFTTAAGLDGTELALLTRRLLVRHGFDVRWEPAVSAMVGEVLAADLGTGGCLKRVSPARRLVELEFFFPVERLVPVGINRFLADYRGAALERPLTFAPLAGLMKGFVDLVFEQDGRYFIADYKSNHLGGTGADYDPAHLPEVMRRHDYDLQYLIYTVALRRYLARRVPGFRYDEHFGGVYYLFVRGMRADDPRRPGVCFQRPDEAAVLTLDELLTGGESA